MKKRLVKNSKKYWEFVRNLRNETSGSFINTKRILDKEHKKYMKKHGKDYYILVVTNFSFVSKEEQDFPIGFIGSVNGDLRLAIKPNFQGKDIGTYMLREYMKINPNFDVKVKIDNEQSLNFFRRNGFIPECYTLKYCEEHDELKK